MSVNYSAPPTLPAEAASPRRPRRRLALLIAVALAALIGGAAAAFAATSGTHHAAARPHASAPARPHASAPAVPTPDQVLIQNGFTPTYLVEQQELISQAATPAISQMLQSAVSGNSSVGYNSGGNGNTMEIVIPVTKAGRQALDTPAALNEIATGEGSGSTAKFAGPYLVITSPAQVPSASPSAT